jgi:hypothetical protein
MRGLLPENFPSHLREIARPILVEDRITDFAWQYPAILEVSTEFARRGYAILGGDVMHDNGHELDYYDGKVYCGNWYLNEAQDESWADYVPHSLLVTAKYIEAYVKMNGVAYWYTLVLADEDRHKEIVEELNRMFPHRRR